MLPSCFSVTGDSFSFHAMLTDQLLSGCSCPEKSWTTHTNRRPGTCTRKTLLSPCSSRTHSQRGYRKRRLSFTANGGCRTESCQWNTKDRSQPQGRSRVMSAEKNLTHSCESHRESLCVCVCVDSCVLK